LAAWESRVKIVQMGPSGYYVVCTVEPPDADGKGEVKVIDEKEDKVVAWPDRRAFFVHEWGRM
jgi:hypothetical protein